MLEIASVLGACQQSAHVQGIHNRFGQDFRHVFLGDAPSQTFGNGCFANASLTHQQGVVFATAAENLNGALNLVFATNERVDLAILGHLVEVLGELLKGRRFFRFFAGFFAIRRRAFVALDGFLRVAFLDAVGNVIDHVQTGHALLVQIVDSMRIFLAKNGHQHVGAGDFFFAIARGLHMHDGALNHTLKTQRGLCVHLVGACNLRRVVFDEI